MMERAAVLSRVCPLVAALLLGCLTAGCWPEPDKAAFAMCDQQFPVL